VKEITEPASISRGNQVGGGKRSQVRPRKRKKSMLREKKFRRSNNRAGLFPKNGRGGKGKKAQMWLLQGASVPGLVGITEKKVNKGGA